MNDSGKKINPNNEKFLNELGRASCDIALGYVTKRLSDRFKDKYSDSVKPEVFRLPIVSRIEMSKFLHSEEELDAFIERFIISPAIRLVSSISNYNALVFGNCQLDIIKDEGEWITLCFSIAAAKKPE